MPNDPSIKILVVDDTVVYRKIVSDILKEIPGVSVVGTAHNGKAALMKISALKPDLLILDIEMPEMTGMEVLEHLQANGPDVDAIILSTLTQRGGTTTIQALERGAFDFIPKPDLGSIKQNREAVKKSLTSMLKAYARQQVMRQVMRPRDYAAVKATRSLPSKATTAEAVEKQKPDIVVIAVSTGGPKALAEMLPAIPPDIGIPILIVQHMPPMFTQSLAHSLKAKCAIGVKEAQSGEPINPNIAYIAPGGCQMKVAAGDNGKKHYIKITDDPPENSCKPSADYLLRSVAAHYQGRATGVVMTGMGSDGTAGMRLMKQKGAAVVAQDEATCVVFGMPKAVIEAGLVDVVVPLKHIAREIMRTVKQP